MDAVRRRHSPDEIKAMLKQAGYGGERVVLMHPTDQTFYDAMSSVVAHVAAPRGHQPRRTVDGLGHGGATSHQQGAAGQGRLVAVPVRRAGGGIPRSDVRHQFARQRQGRLVRLAKRRRRWRRCAPPGWTAPTKPRRKRLDAEIQARAFETVPFIPLGQYLPPAAWRSNLTGMLKGAVPVFWNVTKG